MVFGEFTNLSKELGKLRLETRNKVRAIIAANNDDASYLYGRLCEKISPRELIQADIVLEEYSQNYSFLHLSFPDKPQTKDKFYPEPRITLEKQLLIIDLGIKHKEVLLNKFITRFEELNNHILSGDLELADKVIDSIVEEFGYSHLILRKAAYIKELSKDPGIVERASKILENAGLGSNRMILSSLVHCYQKEQDLLNIKRSVMSLSKSGRVNHYIKNIARITFHPHVSDEDDFRKMLMSCYHSSLIDAIILCNVNYALLPNTGLVNIRKTIEKLNNTHGDIDDIAAMYVALESDGEELFYKHSSAWLELRSIADYRLLQDHFYDSPHAPHNLDRKRLIERLAPTICVDGLRELSQTKKMTSHCFGSLRELENDGVITRSSIFNYIVDRTCGNSEVQESSLIELMDKTSDLVRTIDHQNLRILAKSADSELSKIILYLLLARSSKSELDDYSLRKLIVNRVKRLHNGDLLSFVHELEKKSPHLAKYTYDVCNEDFLALLGRIITTAKAITDTRANLHEWAAKFTGEKLYFDRARNIIVDQQINLIRNEIDDHRIYADIARFKEWYEDEIAREMNTVMLVADIDEDYNTQGDVQILGLIERCFGEFCSNNYFGIASYLGRRIRHGTFRGHLYSNVVSIEKDLEFLEEPLISEKWRQWKHSYEAKIEDIVSEKLHINSENKPNGFLNPKLHNNVKREAAKSCVSNLAREYKINEVTYNFADLISEHCWRIVEYDLNEISQYLKSCKPDLINEVSLNHVKKCFPSYQDELAEFALSVRHKINEQLVSMYSWFRRPQSAAPKVSVNLLYKAVVAEVKQSYYEFNPETDFEEEGDIQLVGGAYHIIYDALYVVIFNAAKHASLQKSVSRQFEILEDKGKMFLKVSIQSSVKNGETDSYVNQKLQVTEEQIENAQTFENRSGIGKLFNIQKYESNFRILNLKCENGLVNISFSFGLF